MTGDPSWRQPDPALVHWQLLELVRNTADAPHRSGAHGRVELRLAGDTLYCANEGEPITQAGHEAVGHAFLGSKRGEEIGWLGLGFKSFLGVSRHPAVFSRSVSFDFDGDRSRLELLVVDPHASPFLVLRLPLFVGVEHELRTDETLQGLASWAQTVVRLPPSNGRSRLVGEMREFSREFLLFVLNVSALRLKIDGDADIGRSLGRSLRRRNAAERRMSRAYHEDPGHVESGTGIEIQTSQDSCGCKEIHELVQNGADALREALGNTAVRRQGADMRPIVCRLAAPRRLRSSIAVPNVGHVRPESCKCSAITKRGRRRVAERQLRHGRCVVNSAAAPCEGVIGRGAATADARSARSWR
ncbi:hypothetical protein ABT297_27260 [Dactylosporangium sp. NPDC000555]|uniref:hypothetical protein n=1 Tax=Dactylosporangium sp. NPDC000555 TaxID=3154260 RepID=UPI003319C65F